jgi:hypothetical protein
MILKEIKKGQVGTGLLIENDGFISIDDPNNKTLKEDLDKGTSKGNWDIPYPFIVHALYQRANKENANGRIYPRDILEKQIELYQQRIQERRAYSECYTPDTLILTEVGWKTLRDVKKGDNILTLNPETKTIEIKPINEKVEYNYKGKMIRIKGKDINDLVTPNHKFHLYNNWKHKYTGVYTAQQILDKEEDFSKYYIPKRGEWKKDSEEFFTLPAMKEGELPKNIKKELKEKYSQDLVLSMKSFMAFMGIYLAEGYYKNKKGKGYGVFITQKKEETSSQIEEMLIELGMYFTKEVSKNKTYTFYISDARLNKYVSQFGDCYNKYVPFEIKNQSKEMLTIFYDWFVLGDGRKKHNTNDIFSTSKQLVLDLNEIQLKIGYSGNFHEENRKDNNGVERLIEGKNCQNMFFSLKSLNNGICLDKRMIQVTEEDYDGEVMCVNVDNHIWYCMCNDKCHWTGNSNHPSDIVLDINNLSTNIIELHWEGDNVVGQMELLLSPGYIKYGIVSTSGDRLANLIYFNRVKLGVSSRGVGSVEQKYGKTIVQDDYELICFDAVTDPSTHNAWIDLNPEGLKPYMESKKNIQNKSYIMEKMDKIISNKLFI